MVYLLIITILLIGFCAYKEHVNGKIIQDLTTKVMAKNVDEYMMVKAQETALKEEPEIEESPLQDLDDVPEEDLKEALKRG